MGFFSYLTGFGGRDMAVDLGTANTLVYVRGRGIVLSEPSVVAIDSRTGEVHAVGIEAKRMLGRTPGTISAIRPLKDGVIADFDVTEEMLRHFIQKVHQNRWAHPRVVVCVPSGVTGVEKRAVEEACLSAGARQAYLIEEPMAAAIGAGLPVGEPTGNMVVDIGGGTSEGAVISLGGIVVSQSIRVGGDELDESIINYVKKEYKLLIGQQTAEEVKLEIGSAYPLEEEVQAEIRGRDLVSGLPKTVVLTSEEVRAALEEPMVQIIDAIKETLDRTPPELASDIMDRGIMLAGGGSLLQGVDERLREETQMPAHRAEPPLTCVAVGSGRSLEEFEAIHRSNRNNSRNNRRPRRSTTHSTSRPFRHVRQSGAATARGVGRARRALADPAHRLLRRNQLRRPAQRPARCDGGARAHPGGREPRRQAVPRPLRLVRLDPRREGRAQPAQEGARRAAPGGHPAAGRRRGEQAAALHARHQHRRRHEGLRAGDRAGLRPLAQHVVLDGRDQQGLERRGAPRPARRQRRGPGGQGQVGVRRQRDRDAPHGPGVRRLGQGRALGRAGVDRPGGRRPRRPPARACPARQARAQGRADRDRGHRVHAAEVAVPAGDPDRHGPPRRRGRRRARPPHPRAPGRRPAQARVPRGAHQARHRPARLHDDEGDAHAVTPLGPVIGRLAALGLLGGIIQLTAVAQITVFGVPADLSPLLVCAVGLLMGSVPGALFGFSIGLFVDTALLQTLGISSLVLTAVGYGAGRLRELRDPAHGLVPVAVGAIGTAVYAIGFSVMQFLLGVDAPVSLLLVRQILLTIVLNTLLALPVYLIVRRVLSPFLPDDPRRRRRRAYTTGGLSPISRA